MKKLLGLGALTLVLASCTVSEPEQSVVVSQVQHKKLSPFKAKEFAGRRAPAMDPGARRIAVLLPLSGQYKDLGESMLHASQLALFEASNGDKVVLIPKDTHGQADGAQRAAQEALNDGAELIIGPIFSKEVDAVKTLTQKQRVPVLSFTTDTTVTGFDTYALGFLPSQQVEHITRFAASQGYDKIVALTPKSEYGTLVNQSLQKVRQSGEVTLVDILPYEGNQIYTGSAALENIIGKLQRAKAQGATAVLFPEAGLPLSAFATALSSNGLRDLKILGTGQWDTPGIHQTPGLQGAWYAAPAPEGRHRFESTYQQQFVQTPPRLASLAYDATALAVALAPHQFEDRYLLSGQGYSGLDGLFRLKQDGTSERRLAVMEVSSQGVNTVSPGAATF